MSDQSVSPEKAATIISGPDYRKLLILAGLIGVAVSVAAWAFLTLVPWIQDAVFTDLPDGLGFDEAPWWWSLPVLAIAGMITAWAIARMPGAGGGIPANGLSAGVTQPSALPSVLLAGLATLGLGLVLGPSSPVIALGMGGALFLVNRAKKDSPDQIKTIVAAAGAFAALAVVFNNPIIAALILVEAMGLGGATAAVIALPGLMAAGIGSLVYFGLNQWSGLDSSAYALQPVQLSALGELTVAELLWTIPVAAIAAGLTIAMTRVGKGLVPVVKRKTFVVVPLAGIAVAALAIAFSEITGESQYAVLFSGSRALNPVVNDAATLSIGTIVFLLAFKALAWGISMGAFRGGPVFPAIFVGTVGGLLAANLPGFPEGAAVPAVVAATLVAALRLPLAACLITLLLTSSAGIQSATLIVVAVVTSYVVSTKLMNEEKANVESL